jgi:hypothetical protein
MNVIEKNGRAPLIIVPFVIALIVVWVIHDPFDMIRGKPLGGGRLLRSYRCGFG